MINKDDYIENGVPVASLKYFNEIINAINENERVINLFSSARTISAGSGIVEYEQRLYQKIGNVVFLTLVGDLKMENSTKVIGFLPEGFRPSANIVLNAKSFTGSTYNNRDLFINKNGQITMYSQSTETKVIASVSFII